MENTLLQHLQTGSTTVCRAWLVCRKDGQEFGFTDHDGDLHFDGHVFVARSGLTASAIEKTNGMAVDNTEVMGALSDISISEQDILAGRYDSAKVTMFLVNWADVSQRLIQFRGTFGEMTKTENSFRVELRGLTEALNIRTGRVYHSECSAVVGDKHCKIDLTLPANQLEAIIGDSLAGRIFKIADTGSHPENWFQHGRFEVKTGDGYGQVGRIKSDRIDGGTRTVELWNSFGVPPKEGDSVRLIVGCDKHGSTCLSKFDNYLNFRGFPHIPGDDWLRATPSSSRGR